MESNILERVDPWRLFQIKPGSIFSQNELRDKFKKLVLVSHPDKPTGSNKKFEIVKECYRQLYQILKENDRVNQPVNNETANNRREEGDEIKINEMWQKKFSGGGGGDGFNEQEFNKFFEQNQVKESWQEAGYGDWLKKTEEINGPTRIGKVAKGQFAQAFEEEKRKLLSQKQSQMVQQRGVGQMNALDSSTQTTFGITKLGNEGVEGFNTKMKNGFQGTDLREALELGVIPVSEQDIQQKTMSAEEMNAQRSSQSFQLTEEDKKRMEQMRNEEQRLERERLRSVQEERRRIEKNFQNVNKGLITYK